MHDFRRLVLRRRIAFGFSAFCLLVAWVEAIQAPLTVRPQGAWDFLFGPLWDALGSVGLVGFWLLLASGFAGFAIGLRLRLQRQASPAGGLAFTAA